jgi:lipid-A-disaccharide synthase
VDIPTLLTFADSQSNSFVEVFKAPAVRLVNPGSVGELPYLKTERGSQVFLWQSFPSHPVTSQCRICLTTVGANTAELGSLGIPMIVLLPTQQLDAMNAWDGLLGLLINLPLVGRPLTKLVNRIFLSYVRRTGKLFAWPNIWAKREIVPELLGNLSAAEVGDRVLDYLQHPDKLQQVRHDLQHVRGQSGAAQKLSDLVFQTMTKKKL